MNRSILERMATRLKKLGNNRFTQFSALTLMSLGVVVIVVPLASAQPKKELTSERISLRDRTGKIKAVIEVTDDGPRLVFYGEGDAPELVAGVDKVAGAFLNLWRREGKAGIKVSANRFGASTISMANDDGVALDLQVDDGPKQQTAAIFLSVTKDDKIDSRLAMRLTEDGEAFMLLDGTGAACSMKIGSVDGGAYMKMYDERDKVRFVLERTKQGDVSASFKGPKEESLHVIPPGK
jgi:hypothetical protein